MKRLLILKDIAYAAKQGGGTIADINEVNLLDEGAIAIFTEGGVLLTAATAAAALVGVDKVFYALGVDGTPTRGAQLSSLIKRKNATYADTAFVAPVAAVHLVGEDGGGTGSYNLPSPLVVGDSAIIRVIDTSFGTQPPINKKTYEYVIKTGDTTVEITAGLVALINGNPDSVVTATAIAGGVGIQLDVKNFDVEVQVVCDGVLSQATVDETGNTVTVAIVYSVGTPAKIAEVEFETNPVEGDTNRVSMPAKWYSKASKVDPAVDYRQTVITFDDIKDYPTRSVQATRETLVLAADEADTSTVLSAEVDVMHALIYV